LGIESIARSVQRILTAGFLDRLLQYKPHKKGLKVRNGADSELNALLAHTASGWVFINSLSVVSCRGFREIRIFMAAILNMAGGVRSSQRND
jgi:hypothetical protein